MRTKTVLGWAVGLALCAGAGRSAEIVGVLRGDVIMAKVDERVLGLRLAGVWVPTPAGLGEAVGYRGDDARQFVIDTLDGQSIRIVPLHAVRPGRPLRVRIQVGEQGDKDLAVLLAEAGLALCERAAAANEEHAEAIYRAERRARAARRGMHDGGYLKFASNQGRQELDLGLSAWLGGPDPATGEAPAAVAAGGAESGSWWAQSSQYDIHRTAVDAIRDWGKSMGLPPDSSRPGR